MIIVFKPQKNYGLDLIIRQYENNFFPFWKECANLANPLNLRRMRDTFNANSARCVKNLL